MSAVTEPGNGILAVAPAITLVTEVAAPEILEYRTVARSLLFNSGRQGASPIHGFAVSHPAFNALIDQLVPGEKSIVHLQQEIITHRGIRAGEVIRTHAEVVALRAEPQGARVALQCFQTDDVGAVVTELKATVLLVGHQHTHSFGGSLPQAAAVRPLAGAAAVDVEVTPTAAFVQSYAMASGDHNPIHTDGEAARQAGFPGPIAHGMSSIAVACEIAADQFAGGRIECIRSIGARFSSPIIPDEPLVFSFRPTAEADAFAFSCATPRGPAVKAGWIRIDAGPAL